tara:strand:+ start:11719 stop:12048 length:330 start_codon:yes stop_codon:yes gene_type:complete
MQPDLTQPQSERGDFNWRKFGHELTKACFADGRSQADISAEMGVTETDLSRARGGNTVSVAKVIAIARWMSRAADDWYVPPLGKSTSCTEPNVKHSECETPRETAGGAQ